MFQRSLQNLRSAWRDIAESARGALNGGGKSGADDPEHLRAQMRACLEGRGGEVSARARAAALGRDYLELDEAGRARFLRILAEDFEAATDHVDLAVAAFHHARSGPGRRAAEAELRAALDPPRRRLLTQFNALPEGVKFLVDLRADLLAIVAGDAALGRLDDDLKTLLASWFDVGFLELRRITWDAPAALLEKLIAYEAVHAIQDWSDLKNRLDSDRRCFAFFHPRMPDEPLIFVEVALVKGLADRVGPLLDDGAPTRDAREADTAIFYSISNAQRGLAGISFGGFLIKRVVDVLSAEFSGLKTFATLSPMPEFRRWLDAEIAVAGDSLLHAKEAERIEVIDAEKAPGETGQASLTRLLALPRWQNDEAAAQALRPPLMRLAARYLLDARKGGRAHDPVAHFHLSNGARVERLNWLADGSEKGLRQSAGMMVNYLYRLDDIAANHEAYSGEGRIVADTEIANAAKP